MKNFTYVSELCIGWNSNDVKRFQDLLIKANQINLLHAKALIEEEKERRELPRL